MQNKKTFLEVEPIAPTYLVSDGNVAKIVKFLFDPEQSFPIKYVIQDVSGMCLIEEDDGDRTFSPLPLHADTVPDYAVNSLFKVLNFDRADTLRKFKVWDINKVYCFPFYDRVISMEDFLDGVLEHFVNKDKNYRSSYSDEKEIIFK